MARPASVSALETPTAQAKDVSLGFGLEEAKDRAWRLLREARAVAQKGDAGLGLGSRGRIRRIDARHTRLGERGI